MAKINYYQQDGTHITLEVDSGASVMRAAVDNGIPGIVGECGGMMMCSTCHVYVTNTHGQELPTPCEEEEEMLDEAASPRDIERSRLGCQLIAGEVFNEIDVLVPPSQY